MEAEPSQPRSAIVFAQQQDEVHDKDPSMLEEERRKHMQR